MPTVESISIPELLLDLHNFRTTSQTSEKNAIEAMIAMSPDKFYAIMESLLDDGYVQAENIIVLRHDESNTVKEGNRRVAALKIIHGLFKTEEFDITQHIISKVNTILPTWLTRNSKVPCLVYTAAEVDDMNQTISRIHGKSEKAGRDEWNSVARARHNRQINKASESGLDILEKYLKKRKTEATSSQKKKWAGDYPLTVLDEAIRVLLGPLGYNSTRDLASNYPKVNYGVELDKIIYKIGLGNLAFKNVREDGFLTKNGIDNTSTATTSQSNTHTSTTGSSTVPGNQITAQKDSKHSTRVHSLHDPKHIPSTLKSMVFNLPNSEKVVALRDELLTIKIDKTPMAFCFLTRSMFEISSTLYCKEHGISTKNRKNEPFGLAHILGEVVKSLTKNSMDKDMIKKLHGANMEIGTPDRILSVTSMNQLVHNPKFSIQSSDIATLFSNILPLLEEMNR